ncbi:hypothetical protein [Chromobacterium vaccinii]|uniref:hypothetical protein n=1 Tax=Chromobacterium vaccinii TaxID=1108595 RepID=UPI001E4E62A5|nr:hypothetical protein [Chromobacterium vaccinii]MCD4499666.1 hypothetical protein [Chromobacterium vaccinii]
MTVREFEVDSIEDDSFIKREIKNFIEYEICLRHERKENSGFIDRLLEIIKEVDQLAKESGYGEELYKVSELLISKVQFGEGWAEVIGFDDPDVSYFFKDIDKYLEFANGVIETYQQEVSDCINGLPKLKQYKLAMLRPESDLAEVYYWWCRVMKRNEGRDEKDWVIRSEVRIEKSEYDLGEEGCAVVKRQVSVDPFPKKTPDVLGTWFWDLMKLNEEDRSKEVMRQRKNKKFSNNKKYSGNKFDQLLEVFDAWDAAEPRVGFEWDETKESYISKTEGMEELFKKFREVEGEVIMPRQVEPALVGLMCWDARKVGRTIDQAVEKVMTDVSAECWNEKGVDVHDKFISWQGEMNKKINAGGF